MSPESGADLQDSLGDTGTMSGQEAVKVIVRCRPLNARENGLKSEVCEIVHLDRGPFSVSVLCLLGCGGFSIVWCFFMPGGGGGVSIGLC